MKFKPMVVLYGSVMQPLKEGQKAHYCQNGLWRSTGKSCEYWSRMMNV